MSDSARKQAVDALGKTLARSDKGVQTRAVCWSLLAIADALAAVAAALNKQEDHPDA